MFSCKVICVRIVSIRIWSVDVDLVFFIEVFICFSWIKECWFNNGILIVDVFKCGIDIFGLS